MRMRIAISARAGMAALVVCLAPALAMLFPATIKADESTAGWLSCSAKTCGGSAECKGDYFLDNGSCKITCYLTVGDGNEVKQNGSATCSTEEF